MRNTVRVACKGSCEGTTKHEFLEITMNLRCQECGVEHEPSDSQKDMFISDTKDEITILREHLLRAENKLRRLEQSKTPIERPTYKEPVWKKIDIAFPCFRCGVPTKWTRDGVSTCENNDHKPAPKARPSKSDKMTRQDIEEIFAKYINVDDDTEVIKSPARLFKAEGR